MERSENWKESWISFRELQKDGSLQEVQQLLKQLVKESLEEKNRRDVIADNLSMLSSFLCPLLLAIRSGHVTTNDAQWGVVLEGVKLMRNLAAGVRDNQVMISNDSSLLSAVADVCVYFSTFVTIDDLTTDLFKVALQLLGNLCVGYPEGQEKIWKLCQPELFRCCLLCGCPQTLDVMCMVLYTCLRESSVQRLEFSPDLLGPLVRCLETTRDPLDWRGLLLELLISRTPLQLLWQQCSPSKEGHILLRYILASLTAYTEYNAEQLESGAQWGAGGGTSQTLTVRGTERSETTLSEVGNSSGGDIYVAMTREENVVCLQRLYTEHAQCLLSHDAAVLTRVSAGPSEDSDGREVELALCTLNLINCVCGRSKVLTQLQDSPYLLQTTLDLLKSLSNLDGSADSARHRSRLALTKPTGNEKLHPLFGFKRDLVRLVANLSYKSPAVQLLVNESGALPLILNQCSIDHHNPYITQWAVLAIRNLCEGNLANQMLVANLEAQGAPDNVQLLQEMGCEVEIGKDGKMKVKGHEKE